MKNKSLYDDLESKEFIQKLHMLGYTKNVCCKKLGLEDKIILKYLKTVDFDRKLILDELYLDELIDITKYCVSRYFNIHDVMREKKELPFDMEKVNENRILLEWNKNLESINPYSIPIKFEEGKSFEVSAMIASIPIEYAYYYNPDIKFENLSIKSITLGEDLNLLTVPIYTHEIMHTQLEDRRLYTNDYQNIEIIPIFVELLIANYLDAKIIDKLKMLRLNDFLSYLISINDYFKKNNKRKEEVDNVRYSSYVNSISKAMELFDNYINASCSYKRKIIYGIQDVLDGKITIEELLEQNKIGKTPGKRLAIVKKWTK